MIKVSRRVWIVGGGLGAAALTLGGALAVYVLVFAGAVPDPFPTATRGLPDARLTASVTLGDGDSYELRASAVQKGIGDTTVKMLAYNGSVPGPTLRVQQGSEIDVQFVNDTGLDATVHWHGLRLDNRFDGVPYDTQAPVPPGGRFTYHLRFPDPGVFWYHPHLREDYGQEMGLYGNIIVEPRDPAYWPPADRDEVVVLDDILIEGGKVAAFSQSRPTHVAMGRYGNVLLVNGATDGQWRASRGEVVRYYFTNSANVRPINVRIPGARMKLVGSDNGRYEQEQFVDAVLLAPSERAVVDVLFEQPGTYPLEHRTPERSYPLGTIAVADADSATASAPTFDHLRANPDFAGERAQLAGELERAPDKTLAFIGEMPGMGKHAESEHGGIEWEDTMPLMNKMSTPGNMIWQLVDRDSGAANHAITWAFREGERVKLRLVNEPDSDHPMQHPFHIHGQRFLVLARDGVAEPNLVWKDTVLVRSGETVDLLVEMSNPGVWMAHCHIAEHAEGGMMFTFTVGNVRRSTAATNGQAYAPTHGRH